MIIPLDPPPNPLARLFNRLERLLPDTLFHETPKESLNDAVLFWRVGRDELLWQPIVMTRLPELTTLKNQAIVAM
jgi:hypothetical protein